MLEQSKMHTLHQFILITLIPNSHIGIFLTLHSDGECGVGHFTEKTVEDIPMHHLWI